MSHFIFDMEYKVQNKDLMIFIEKYCFNWHNTKDIVPELMAKIENVKTIASEIRNRSENRDPNQEYN